MKNRILTLFLGILIILSIAIPVFAEGGELVLTVGDYEASAGNTVAVDIIVRGNPGICAMNFGVEYDQTKLSLVSVSNGVIFSEFSVDPLLEKNPVIIQYLDGKDNSNIGKLVTLVFKVLDTLTAGESTSISIDSAEISDFAEETITYGGKIQGTITAAAENQTKTFDDIFEFENTVAEYNGSKITPGVKLKEGKTTDANWKVFDYSIKPRNVGTYNINATVVADGYDDKIVSGTLTITPKDAEIVIDNKEAFVGDPYTLTYTFNGLAGSDYVTGTPTVIVDENVYSITQGSLRIIDGESGKASQNYKLKVENGTLTLKNVLDTAISLNVGEEGIVLKEGESFQLAAIFTPSNTTIKDINWTVSDDNVTVVNGLVTAGNLESGYSATAIVTATSAENNTATCQVTVVCNHHLEYVEASEATCSKTGKIAHYICHDCGMLYEDSDAKTNIGADDVVIEKDKDNHAYGTVTEGALPPSETNVGKTGTVKCANPDCGAVLEESRDIPKLAHKNHTMTKHEGTEPTCISEGTKEYWTCSFADCRGIYYGKEDGSVILNTIVIPKDPTKHAENPTEEVNKKAPTCTEKGYSGDTVYLCCNLVKEKGSSDGLPATGHSVGDIWLIDDEHHYKVCSTCHEEVLSAVHTGEKATCTEASYCSVCNHLIAKAKGHVLGNPVEEEKATCTTAGSMKHWKCSVCENLFADQFGKIPATAEGIHIAPLGHTWGEWTESGSSNVKRKCECGEAEYRVVEQKTSASGLSFDLYTNESDQTADLEIKLTTTSFNNITGGEVKIDAANITSGDEKLDIKQVSIPTTTVSSVGTDTTLAVELTTGSVAFTGDALNTLNAGEGSVSLKVEPVGGDDGDVVSYLKDGMNNDQVNTVNDKLGGREVLGAVDLSLDLVGEGQNTALGKSEKDENGEEKGGFGGDVTISIPFEGSKDHYKMVYIHEDGTTEEVDAKCGLDPETNKRKLTFTVTHFSQFIVVDPMIEMTIDKESDEDETEPKTYALLETAVKECAAGGEITILGNIDEAVVVSKAMTIHKGSDGDNGYFTANNIKAGTGYVLVDDTENHAYRIIPAAASIDGHYFATLDEAVTNAANGRTIKLAIDSSYNTPIGKPIRIELEENVTLTGISADADSYIIMKHVEESPVYEFVKAKAIIEELDDKLYETLDKVSAEAVGKTVKLLADLDSFTFDAPVKIDLNGHKIKDQKIGSSTDEQFRALEESDITEVFFKPIVKNNAITAVLLGDADADDKLEDADIAILENYFTGKADAEDVNKVETNVNQIDVDNSGGVTRRDLMIISRYVDGWNGYTTLPYVPNAAN